jgi:hypothetical protein
MAVELRCPDCRARLRLADEPEPGEDVECPECNATFPAPDPETGEAPDSRGKKKKKKKPVEDAEPKKSKSPPPPTNSGDKAPRRRKAKKKETNSGALIAVIVGALLFLTLVVGLLVWYFSRKPASYEMMAYLPVDATEAVGLNLGHMHKYAEFRKAVEPTYSQMGFQKAINMLGTAFGIDAGDVPDYMVQGWGKSGGSLVIRTKKTFDPEDLKKLPGAQEGKTDGVTFYVIPPVPKLFGGTGAVKVFAPSNRLVVFAEYNLPSDKFQGIVNGNKDGETLNKRLGSLGTRTTRGTFWNISVLDTTNRPKEPEQKAMDDGSGAFQKMSASTASKGKGMGFKASLGSRAIRFEVALWFEDSDISSELVKKFKESDLTKAQDDSSLDPPKWWKEFQDRIIGSKKVANELFVNLGYKSSGDLFVVYSECETKLVMEVVTSLIQKMTGQNQGGMNTGGPIPGGPGMQAPPGGAPPAGAPGLPGGVAVPGGS